jgi:hypothetical protein
MDKIFAPGDPSQVTVLAFLGRMGCALVLGALIAWRPLSRLGGSEPARQSHAHALFMMTLAATLVVMVIGDSLARAFGVVGLGSFVRFRTSLKDPRDAVLFFVAIGVGMACGLGQVVIAALGVATMSLALVPLERSGRPDPQRDAKEEEGRGGGEDGRASADARSLPGSPAPKARAFEGLK